MPFKYEWRMTVTIIRIAEKFKRKIKEKTGIILEPKRNSTGLLKFKTRVLKNFKFQAP
jgi:hypothetical protein